MLLSHGWGVYLVEHQGGTISFNSEEGKGTTFFFEFPIHI